MPVPKFGQAVRFFRDGDADRTEPMLGFVTKAHGDADNNCVCHVAVCPKTGGITPHFNVPENVNDTPNGAVWEAACEPSPS